MQELGVTKNGAQAKDLHNFNYMTFEPIKNILG
jgi:hypothetical protein